MNVQGGGRSAACFRWAGYDDDIAGAQAPAFLGARMRQKLRPKTYFDQSEHRMSPRVPEGADQTTAGWLRLTQ